MNLCVKDHFVFILKYIFILNLIFSTSPNTKCISSVIDIYINIIDQNQQPNRSKHVRLSVALKTNL